MGETFYRTLGVSEKSTQAEIKAAYLNLARIFHPDKNPNPVARKEFLLIQSAYETLLNPERRKVYDLSLSLSDSATNSVRLTTIVSQPAIARIEETQRIFTYLELRGMEDDILSDPPPVSICLVIDKSTSMKGDRIEMVRAGIKKLIRALGSSDTISIVSFNDYTEIVLSPTKISNPAIVDMALDRIKTGGGTEIYNGIKAGMELLWQGKNDNSSKYMFVLTDGRTYGDEGKTLELVKKGAKQGIILNALGIGHEWNDIFLEKLSNLTGGTSIFIELPQDLYNYFEEFSTSIHELIAKNLIIEFASDSRVKLTQVYRVSPLLGKMESENNQFFLGSISRKINNAFLFSFDVDPVGSSNEEVVIARGNVLVENCISSTKEELRVNLAIPILDGYSKTQPPTEIVRALYNINLYEMQEKSRIDIKNGDIKTGVDRLERLANQVDLDGRIDFATDIREEVSQIKKINRFSVEGEKRIRYGTKNLTLEQGVRNNES